MIETALKNQSKLTIFNNFCQIPNILLDLAITGTKNIPAAAFQTLCFILRLHPDTVITPKNISYLMQLKAISNEGKYKKPDTISRELRQLETINYAGRKYNRNSKGKFSGAQYWVSAYPTTGKNFPMDNDDDKPVELKEKNEENQNSSIGKNFPSDYNKERAVYNTNNTIKNTSCSCDSVNQKILTPCRGDFLALVPKELRDKNTWKLINSVRKYFEDGAYELMIKAFTDPDIWNPIDWLWGSVNKRRKKEPDNQDRQSLNKPSSTADIPFNQQTKQAFKEKKEYEKSIDEYRKQNMFMTQGTDNEPKKIYHSRQAKANMERMKRIAQGVLKNVN